MNGSGWISGLRIVAWIQFVVIVIGSIWLGDVMGDGHILFILGGLIGGLLVAFLSTALLMILLDAASDIRAIKNLLNLRLSQQPPDAKSPSLPELATKAPAESAKVCTACGKLAEGNSRFCTNCGDSLRNT